MFVYLFLTCCLLSSSVALQFGFIETVAGSDLFGDGRIVTDPSVMLCSVGLTTDSNAADFCLHKTRKINLTSRIISSLPPPPSGFGAPQAVSVDPFGNFLLIADSARNQVFLFNSSTGLTTLLAGNGTISDSGD